MWKRFTPYALTPLFLIVLSTLLSSCQLFGGSTQVSFLNDTAFTLASIQLGPLTVGSLAPSIQSGDFSIPAGQDLLSAESQGGAWTNAVLLSVAAGHSYLVTFNPAATFSQITVSIATTN
jgi:hypothetical protein